MKSRSRRSRFHPAVTKGSLFDHEMKEHDGEGRLEESASENTPAIINPLDNGMQEGYSLGGGSEKRNFG